MVSTAEPVVIETRVVPPPNTNIDSVEPVLGTIQGHHYHGRIFIEVWEGDARMVIVPQIPALTARALAALEGRSRWGEVKRTPWQPDWPVTGEIPGKTFLGRVVVEVWDNVAVVGIAGSEVQVKEQAIQVLRIQQAG